jgi:hypothetical protein
MGCGKRRSASQAERQGDDGSAKNNTNDNENFGERKQGNAIAWIVI